MSMATITPKDSPYSVNNFWEIIENNAKSHPNKTIIFDQEKRFSNLEFKKIINKISNLLILNNIKYGDKVAIFMNNSWQFIANAFAISKIGGIIVPINSFLKEEELSYILNNAKAKALFINNKFINEAKNLLSKTNLEKIFWVDGSHTNDNINVDYDTMLISNIDDVNFIHNATINDTAMIVYTSGTTGKPKGAMLSFKNLLSNCEASKKLFNLKNGQLGMICYLPMFHAFTFTVNVLLPIYTNSKLIIIRSIGSRKDFKYLLKQLLFNRFSYFTGIPEVYNAMVKAKLPWYFHWLHNVKGFISGAAPLSDDLYAKFNKEFRKGTLLQGYGISECSPVVSCNSVKGNRPGSVGKPLDEYKVKIFDDNMQELPTGNVGEICVNGDCVMQGYYENEEATKEAIINGWFKTGDLGKLDSDGYIYIIDRKKDIIIHKGMNIYPREIEEVLYTNNKIQGCAVIGIKEQNDEIPIAYIELKEHETTNEHEIKEFLKPHLAPFKIPRKIIVLNQIPKNATGKILKRELRDLYSQQHQG